MVGVFGFTTSGLGLSVSVLALRAEASLSPEMKCWAPPDPKATTNPTTKTPEALQQNTLPFKTRNQAVPAVETSQRL